MTYGHSCTLQSRSHLFLVLDYIERQFNLQVLEGVEPNEHGTWQAWLYFFITTSQAVAVTCRRMELQFEHYFTHLQYGRGGWCDGANVRPWVFDITRYVSPAGEKTKITYEGLFRGKTPNPAAAPGYIMLESSLVFLSWGMIANL